MKTMFGRMLCVGVLAVAMIGGSATSALASPDFGVTGGLMEYVGTPGHTHYGLYPSAGGYASFATDFGSVTPGLALEYSPEFSAWGFFPSVTTDFSVTDHVGVDVIASAWNDQEGGDFAGGAIYVGGGLGASYFLTDTWTLSASWNVFRGVRNNPVTIYASPGVNISYTFK